MRAPAVLLLFVLLCPTFVHADLDAYLARPEPDFQWTKESVRRIGGCEVHDLTLVSQTWRGIRWQHRLRIVRPPAPEFPDHGVLFISGGRTGGKGSDSELGYSTMAASAAGMTMAMLYAVPNQPLFDNLVEDDLIAHTCVQYLASKDAEWPLLFPMVKSAVKAMDVVSAYSEAAWGRAVDRFFVTGASKRGWTTWLTAAADPRVQGIMPMVFDNLNVAVQMPQQVSSFGDYSREIDEYTHRGLQAVIGTEDGRNLVKMLDPYHYRSRIQVPKLIVNGTNDPYWTIDALNHYWNGLSGEKAVIYVPNAGHGAGTEPSVMTAGLAFVRRIASGRTLPRFEWTHGNEGGRRVLTVSASEPVAAVRIWSARSDTRDFRRSQWTAREMSAAADVGAPSWTGGVEVPEDGYVALFAEVTFVNEGRPFALSTSVRVSGKRRLAVAPR